MPETLGAESRKRVLDCDGAAQAFDVLGGIGTLDAASLAVRRRAVSVEGNELVRVVVALAEVGAGALDELGRRHVLLRHLIRLC